ncbi:two-component system sensor histidine kinase CreC [Scleromatobacter humisilvae]|uniref:histidine kinase n=1 Tax=Scleromatobacter humisilvae TaxID=2897159 RepID=A0A9X1YLM3_9BURK|nr:two-component system sensor histidine kinase CreC [Scleromatobacter humisilvae]MCK9688824.1 two-component system sensor histidine kinase CreC [Scleromatobacter humisilvae]
MRLGLRLLFAFFVIVGLAGFFALQVFESEVKPSAREVMEDVLVDTANLLAEQAAADLRAMPPGGTLQDSRLAQQVAAYRRRPVDIQIWGLHKRTLDLRVYVTDATGRVVLDSGFGPEAAPPAAAARSALGADYSKWRDVYLTLRGQYGARATRSVPEDDASSVMYVAAPVRDGARVIGVVTVGKPLATVQQFIDRAQRRILVAGFWLLGLSAVVGVLVTLWMVRAVRQLKAYATHVHAGERVPVPKLPGELGDLAVAVDEMRERLEDRERLEHTVRALTHELKSPLTAIQGAAELLGDELPADDRERFARQIQEQSLRLRDLVDRMLELSRLEGQRAIANPQPIVLLALIDEVATSHVPLAIQRGVGLVWESRADVTLAGDPESLKLLFSNLWSNALDFAPEGTSITASLRRVGAEAVFTMRDTGPGVSDFALPQLGQRFFSLPRPRDGRRGSGLGLAIVRQAAALHGGSVSFQHASPGLLVTLRLPAAA